MQQAQEGKTIPGEKTLADLLGPLMAGNLLWWSEAVFKPARLARRLGSWRPDSLGDLPLRSRLKGSGPSLSLDTDGPLLMEDRPDGYEDVEEFDRIAPLYNAAVTPFSAPIYADMMALLAPYLAADCRILDPSCGPGHEALKISASVPRGEVIAADFSQGMVNHASRLATEAGISNMAFVQADVGSPPEIFHHYFDIVFCELSFHHYPDAAAAMAGFRKVLREDGLLIIGDPGPAWFNRLAKGFSTLADPGFNRHYTGEDFQVLARDAGFKQFYWVESLPGIGITLARA